VNQPDDPGVGPLDDPDPFDPTGYYARKEIHRAEMLPYVAGCIGLAILIVVGRVIWQALT
jgi:hypothetical protein